MSSLDRFKSLDIMVGVPSTSSWNTRFALSLNGLMTYFMTHKIGDFKSQKLRLCNTRGSILPNLRVDIVRDALKHGCSHLLWVDSDQTFPQNTLERLILRDKDVVAANIATKQIPAQPTARRAPKPGEPNSGMPVYTDIGQDYCEKVWRVGTGLMLVKMRVFKKIGVNVFGSPWREDWQKYQGEDWSMCEAMEAAGFDIWVDHGLSQEVGHLGEYEYTHDVVGEIVQEKVANG